MQRSISLPAAAFVAVGASTTAQAGEIYNNLGPGNTFGNGGRIIQGPDVNNIGDVDQAARFNTGSMNHEGILVAAGIGVSGPPNNSIDGRGPIAIQVWTDAGASGPGMMLATETIDANAIGDYLISATFGALTLNANTNYWVVLNGLTTFNGSWQFNNTGASGTTIGRSGNGPWDPIRDPDPSGMLSLRVVSRVETVPEPASMVALSLGAVALLKRRKKA